MKVLITDENWKTVFTIAPGAWNRITGGSPEGLKIDEERVGQEDEVIRALDKSFTDRMNKKNTMSFSITQNLGSLSNAEAYMLDVGEDCPNAGNIIFVTESDKGSNSRYMKGALISRVGREQMGESVRANFSIVGGSISTSKT